MQWVAVAAWCFPAHQRPWGQRLYSLAGTRHPAGGVGALLRGLMYTLRPRFCPKPGGSDRQIPATAAPAARVECALLLSRDLAAA
jgi:hypothetical protein